MRTRRMVEHTRDRYNCPIVEVPLANSDEPATIDEASFALLREKGISDQWFLHSNGCGQRYVRVCMKEHAGNLASVARLIANPERGFVVKHFDGNPLNLRRDNLRQERGRAPGVTLKPRAIAKEAAA